MTQNTVDLVVKWAEENFMPGTRVVLDKTWGEQGCFHMAAGTTGVVQEITADEFIVLLDDPESTDWPAEFDGLSTIYSDRWMGLVPDDDDHDKARRSTLFNAAQRWRPVDRKWTPTEAIDVVAGYTPISREDCRVFCEALMLGGGIVRHKCRNRLCGCPDCENNPEGD